MTGPRVDPLESALAAHRARYAPPRQPSIDEALARMRSAPPAVDPAFADVTGDHSTTAVVRGGPLALPIGGGNRLQRPDFQAMQPELRTHIRNMAQGLIPGAQRALAGVDVATGRAPSYGEAVAQIDRENAAIPAPLRYAERLYGGLPLGKLLALMGGKGQTLGDAIKSGAKVGAGLGGADAALNAHPMSLGERAIGTVIGTGVGTVIGGGAGALARGGAKGSEFNTLRKRVAASPTRGATAVEEIDPAIEAATTQNYGAVRDEAAAAGGTSPAIQAALEDETVKPFADMFRNSRVGRDADDATILQEAYKLISRQRRGNKNVLAKQYDAKVDLADRELRVAQGVIKDAAKTPGVDVQVLPAPETAQSPPPDIRTALREFQARPGVAAARNEGTPAQQLARRALERHTAEGVVSPPLTGAPGPRVIETPTPAVMPSLPTAISEKARMEAERKAFESAGDAARRALQGGSVRGARLLKDSPEAFLRDVRGMTPGEARAGLPGVLGAAKEAPGVEITPETTLFGYLGRLATQRGKQLSRIAPLVRALDQQAGNTVRREFKTENLMRLLGLFNAPIANPER